MQSKEQIICLLWIRIQAQVFVKQKIEIKLASQISLALSKVFLLDEDGCYVLQHPPSDPLLQF